MSISLKDIIDSPSKPEDKTPKKKPDSFKCPKCGKSFPTASQRDQHLNNAHAPKALDPYKCPHCNKRFKTPDGLDNHLRDKHGIGAKPKKNDYDVEKYSYSEDIDGDRIRIISFIWANVSGVLAYIASLLIFLLAPGIKDVVPTYLAVLVSFPISYAVFAFIYCLVSRSYILKVLVWSLLTSFTLPKIVLNSWDIDIGWLIIFKILLAPFSFVIALLGSLVGLAVSIVLSAVSFIFVLIHNESNNYGEY